ncbi:MAG: hypothetical protein H6741_21970 [Alphaproteobacteria bacterium]|nr:hypothetical protein [Alphaproteobacteria bacterium]MCB9795380.1 hypothetical protein [Alphaproteobacteria bacterium]
MKSREPSPSTSVPSLGEWTERPKDEYRYGGGKNSKHSSLDKRNRAEERYQEICIKCEEMRRKPKKTKEDKKELRRLEKKRRHLKKMKDFTGENHSMTPKGT